MYWDVVEVKPEPDYRLFVRFRDGLTGYIDLERANMTGVLSPLADQSFFEQVFIDCGAVAWPGEVDLGARRHVLRRRGPRACGNFCRTSSP